MAGASNCQMPLLAKDYVPEDAMRTIMLICLLALYIATRAMAQDDIVCGTGYLYNPAGDTAMVQPKAPASLQLPVERRADEQLKGPVHFVREPGMEKEYDRQGRVIRIAMSYGEDWRYLKTVAFHSDGGRTETVTTPREKDILRFDAAGRLRSELAYKRDARGRFIFLRKEVHRYNAAGNTLGWQRWTPKEGKPGVNITKRRQQFDGDGRLQSIETTAPTRTERLTYQYNPRGLVSGAEKAINGAVQSTMRYTYDAHGRLTTQNYIVPQGSGMRISYHFDPAGQLAMHETCRLSSTGEPTVQLRTQHRYDEQGRLTQSFHSEADGQPCLEWVPTPIPVRYGLPPVAAVIRYTYDAQGTTPQWTAFDLQGQPVHHALYLKSPAPPPLRYIRDSHDNWTRAEGGGQLQVRTLHYY